jgi:hypothetical protein
MTNETIIALPSERRTDTVARQSPAFENLNGRGLLVIIDITATPSGSYLNNLIVRTMWRDVEFTFDGSAARKYAFLIYPGANPSIKTGQQPNNDMDGYKDFPLGGQYQILVDGEGGENTDITYSVSVQHLL